MKTRILLAALALSFSSNLFSQDPNFHIYLCFGQSNMVGQGTIALRDKSVNSRFKVFQALDCSNNGRNKELWYTAVPPLCHCWSKLSPADYFGKTMVANLPDSISVGVINVAVGGCDIRLFDKDLYEAYDSTYPEDWFLDIIEAYEGNPYLYLMNLAKLAKQDGVIKGILLHQGETNTGNNQWPSYVKKIYHDMLNDLSLNADSVPLLAGEVVHEDQDGCCSSMNSIIARLPDTIPTAHVISSQGCTDQVDNTHFDAEGYRKLGRRYAVRMLSLMGYEAVYGEAECAIAGEKWRILADSDASNGTFITTLPGEENLAEAPANDSSILQLDFTVGSDTSYYVFGRCNNTGSETCSFWIRVDEGDFSFVEMPATDNWQWLEFNMYELTAGEHSLKIAFSEEGSSLDKLVVKNSRIPPVDVGEEANNVCEAEISTVGMGQALFEGYVLEQNYPNPFSNSTNISFRIPVQSYVSLKVFDIQGTEIAELAGKEFSPGKHTLGFITRNLAAGSYFYVIEAGGFSATRTMTIPAE